MSSRVCPECGRTFEVQPRVGGQRKYCSQACYYKHNWATSNRAKTKRRDQARRAWAGDEAAKLYQLALKGLDKLEEYVYNNYQQHNKGKY